MFFIFAHPQKLVSQNVSIPGIRKSYFRKRLSNLGLYPQKLVPQKLMPH